VPAEGSVAYVVSRWGEPTQTFVRREAESLWSRIGEVVAWSIKEPRPTESAVPIGHLGVLRTLGWFLVAFARNPRSCCQIFMPIVRLSAPRNLLQQLAAAVTGVAWSARWARPPRHIHAHFGWVAATAAWAAATYSGWPFSVTLHAFELHSSAKQDRFTEVPLRAAQGVFVVTAADIDLVRQRWGVEAHTIRMGLPDPWFEEGEPVTREPWLLLSVGSLVEKKGHADLIRALAEADPRWHLVICGEGPARRQLEHLVGELGLAARVELLGVVDESEVRRLLERAAVFCLASVEAPSGDKDGMPVALMEAMARGVPVVSTRVGGIPELVGGSGRLVSPRSPGEFARAIDGMRSRSVRSQAATRGRQRLLDGGFRSSEAIEPLVRLLELEHGVLR
jgi:glycosyltransferase involved in cell wall biosynthesis